MLYNKNFQMLIVHMQNAPICSANDMKALFRMSGVTAEMRYSIRKVNDG